MGLCTITLGGPVTELLSPPRVDLLKPYIFAKGITHAQSQPQYVITTLSLVIIKS